MQEYSEDELETWIIYERSGASLGSQLYEIRPVKA
jgi:hypothetical protein